MEVVLGTMLKSTLRQGNMEVREVKLTKQQSQETQWETHVKTQQDPRSIFSSNSSQPLLLYWFLSFQVMAIQRHLFDIYLINKL